MSVSGSETATIALKLGAATTLLKPVTKQTLLRTVYETLAQELEASATKGEARAMHS